MSELLLSLKSLPHILPGIENSVLTRALLTYGNCSVELGSTRNRRKAHYVIQAIEMMHNQQDSGLRGSFAPHQDIHGVWNYLEDDIPVLNKICRLSSAWDQGRDACKVDHTVLEGSVKESMVECADFIFLNVGKRNGRTADCTSSIVDASCISGGSDANHPCGSMPPLDTCTVEDLVSWAEVVVQWVKNMYLEFIGFKGFPVRLSGNDAGGGWLDVFYTKMGDQFTTMNRICQCRLNDLAQVKQDNNRNSRSLKTVLSLVSTVLFQQKVDVLNRRVDYYKSSLKKNGILFLRDAIAGNSTRYLPAPVLADDFDLEKVLR